MALVGRLPEIRAHEARAGDRSSDILDQDGASRRAIGETETARETANDDAALASKGERIMGFTNKKVADYVYAATMEELGGAFSRLANEAENDDEKDEGDPIEKAFAYDAFAEDRPVRFGFDPEERAWLKKKRSVDELIDFIDRKRLWLAMATCEHNNVVGFGYLPTEGKFVEKRDGTWFVAEPMVDEDDEPVNYPA